MASTHPLAAWIQRWQVVAAPAAKAQTSPLEWVALLVRLVAILDSIQRGQLRGELATLAAGWRRHPRLETLQRLLRLQHPEAQPLAGALQDTAASVRLLAWAPLTYWHALWRDLQAALPQADDLAALYLSVEGGAQRQSLGQFYTPPELVDRMWTLALTQMQALGVRPDLLVDPSAGCGTFLRAAPPAWRAIPRWGCEMQAVPRTLARLRALGGAPTQIVGGNALVHALPEAQCPLVIGNPPWRNPSPALRDPALARWLRQGLMPYAWEYDGVRLAQLRGCNHGIREDSVFFLGRVLQWLQPRGVAVLVTSDSWLEAPTYTLLRRYLLDTTRVHSVLRLGACFAGVRERAAVVVLSRGFEPAGRQQGIVFAEAHRPLRTTRAHGDALTPRPKRAAKTATVRLDTLFVHCMAGAQSGCAPLFLGRDPQAVQDRVQRLLHGDYLSLCAELAEEVRGGALATQTLLQRLRLAQERWRVTYTPGALRPIWAHFRRTPGMPASKQGWCYFDARLWLFPRVPRTPAQAPCFWDVQPKLVFRDVYDPHDKPIAAHVDTDGWVCDNHVFNGGTRVVAVRDAQGRSLLSPTGLQLRQRYSSDAAFLAALAACLNSPQAQAWGPEHPRQAWHIPLSQLA